MKPLELFGFTLFREDPGVISSGPRWVCFYDCYMHADESLPRLIWSLITEFRHDRHLIG